MLKKISIILITILLVLVGFISRVNAETKFSLEKDSYDVKLNGKSFITYTGGTGTTTWISEDPSIATVENGMIKGLKIGKTKITATRGNETATAIVNVVYNSIQIGANAGESVQKVNLVLNEHDSETLVATVKDTDYKNVSNPVVSWKSSDNSIVKIDTTSGKITAVKSGKVTITAEAAGVTKTCEVIVYDAPEFTDFKNAKYETSLDGYLENLKISGITPENGYYYIITANNTKPEINLSKNRNY